MSIEDILKPKSEEEINDLERRGFRYNKGKWKFFIDISPLTESHRKSGNNNKFKNGIIKILENKIADIEIYTNKEEFEKFKWVIKQFKKLKRYYSAEDLDIAMKELYDWADENNVWIESLGDSI